MANYEFATFSYLYFFTTVLALGMALFLLRRRSMWATLYLALLELAVAEWAFSAAFETAALTVPLKIFWSQVSYLGVVSGPLFYFFFAVEHSRQTPVVRPAMVAALAVIPTVTFLLAATNHWHHWIWTEVTISEKLHLAIYGHGPWFWIFVTYTYFLLSAGVISLYRAVFRFPEFYRPQFWSLLIGSVFPLVGNIMYVFGLNPLPGMDWTPITFALTGIILAWGIFRLQIFDLLPIARSQLIEKMVDGVLVLDGRNRIVDLNPAAQRMLGSVSERNIGSQIEDMLPDWPGWDLLHADESGSVEIAVGEERPVFLDLLISSLRDQRDRLIGRLLVLRDITDRKRVEQALQQLNATLEAQVVARTAEIRAEQQKSETILRSVGDAIILLDLELRIQYANEAFDRMTGFAGADLLDRPLGELGLWPELLSEGAVAWEMLAQGDSWRGEAVFQRRDGRKYDADLTIAPVRDAGGELVGFVVSHQDISQRKELDRARSRFLDNVTHELRTPLTNIKLYLYMLRQIEDREKRASYYQVLNEQTSLLENLIQDSLEMTLMDSGQCLTAWQALDLPGLMQETVDRFREQAEQAGLELEINLSESDLPAVMGDGERLAQALAEVVENAVLYVSPGGSIVVSADRQDLDGVCWVRIEVKDKGPGIAKVEQGRIFERFARGSQAEARQVPGVGLGLSVARAILEAHGGRVTVASEMAVGSTFSLWLRAVSGSDRAASDE